MRRSTLLLLVALCVPLATHAQVPGHIGIYGNPEATKCHIEDIFPRTIQAYVVHALHDGAMAGAFTVSSSEGFTGVFLGDIEAPGMLKFGSAPTGVDIGYGGCHFTLTHVLTVTYYLDGRSQPCSYLEITPTTSGNTTGILMVRCDQELDYAEGGRAYVNGNASCQCFAAGSPTPTERSTWGGIKDMYARQ